MKRKRIAAAVLAAVLLAGISANLIYSHIRNTREEKEFLTEGIRLAVYQIKLYIETGDREYFHRAAVDMQSLEQAAADNSSILSSEYRKEAFISLITAFRYYEQELMTEAKRLMAVLELIAGDTEDDYPYDQLNTIINNIT